MKFKGMLFCTDLDGTLLRGDKTISEENREAIEYFKSEGGAFTFITGRMPSYSMDVCEAIAPNAPFGCVNGGGVYDHRKGEYAWTHPIDPSVKALIAHVDKTVPNVGIAIHGFHTVYFCRETESLARFRSVTRLPNITADYRKVDEPCGKVLFSADTEEKMTALQEALFAHPLASEFSFVRSERTLFEILPKGISKGTAFGKMVALLGVDPKKTIAIGDYSNDIEMFKAAHIGVAVANACDEAKAAADYITVSNEEHAIAQVISDIERGALQI